MLQAIFHDGSVGMEFMTDDSSEAEEMRAQWLAFDCVAEVIVVERDGMGQLVVDRLAEFRRGGAGLRFLRLS